MLLNENLFETLAMTKDEYLKDAAKISWESGHSYDPDDFSYFKRVCKEDGYNVNEEDFQKYWEYFDECRANQFADEDNDSNNNLGLWEEMDSKQVKDHDGFTTDYTWYVKDNEDGSETHVMIFGDQDLYTPMNSEPDAEFDNEDIAREWFDNYYGFDSDDSLEFAEFAEERPVDDLDESILIEKETDPYAMSMKEVVKKIIDKFGNYKYQYNLKAEEYQRYFAGNIYNKKFFAPNDYLALFSMTLHKPPTIANLEEYFEPAELLELFEEQDSFEKLLDFASSVWWGDGDDFIISLDNLTTGETLYAAEYEDPSDEDDEYDWDEELEEAIIHISKAEMNKLDKEVEEATKEVAQYNIKLNRLSDGSVEPDFSETPEDRIDQAKDAFDRYQKALKARPDRAKDIITYTEALHGTDELNQFIEVSKELGFIGPAQMKHILEAGKKEGKSELETLLWVKETFDGKLPDSLIDGLTDEFLEIAEEIGITDQKSYEQFVANEVEPGETYTQAIKRYKQELIDAGVDLSKLTEGKLEEIAVRNIDEPAVFDAIANAKAYIHEKKYAQAIDALNYAANLLVEPMNESAMSNLDLEIKEAGGKKSWKEKARQELADMIENLEYLKTYAPKEVNAGGNYDSITELQDDIEDLEKAINELNVKLNFVDSIKTIGGDQE